LLVLLLLVEDTLQRCSYPQAEEGHDVTEGCLQRICKSGFWRSYLVYNMCCYEGQAYAINTTISSTISEDGCAKASVDCVEEMPGNARMVLSMKNYCEDYATEQQLEEIKEMLLEHKEAGSGSGCQEDNENSKDEREDTKVLWAGPGRESGGKSEVLSLPDLTPLDCNLQAFPKGDYEGYTVRYTSEGIHMCGGMASDYLASSSCYLLTTTGYQNMPGLLYKRFRPASVETTLGWWVTGGHGIATTELWSNNQWQEHVRLPEPWYGHCMIKINESHILITGGHTESNEESKSAFLYSEETGFTRLEDMKKKRSYHGCSLINDNVVFVAGGYEEDTEYLNLTTLNWTAGPNLNIRLGYLGLSSADMIGSLLISAEHTFKLETLGLSDVQQWQWQQVEAATPITFPSHSRYLAISANFCL